MRRALLLLALPSLALAAPSANHAWGLINEWRIEEATTEVRALRGQRPGDPEVLFLDGELEFLHGDYDAAAKTLASAQASVRAPLEPAVAEELRQTRDLAAATAEATRGYQEATSPSGRFVVRYSGRDALLVPYAFEALDAAYRAVAEHDFGAPPPSPVRVEIYPEVAALAKVSTLTLQEIETSGTIALCKYNRLMIVSPRALARGYPWLDTLTHEFTHFVVSRASHNTVPIWFHEGLAKFEERRWRQEGAGDLTPTMEHLLATALERGHRLITFDEMYPSMAKLPSQADTALAFAEVFTVVSYLHEKRGWAGVRAVVERMKDGRGDASAVAEVLGESFEEFQKSWRAWLASKKLKARPGLIPSSLKFVKATDAKKPGAEKDGSGDDGDTQEIGEKRARELARLGGMLRARHRLAAAAVEYGKAQALVGPGHPAVASRLARTLLEIGQYDRAIAAAEPAAALYPDLAGPSATIGEAWLKKGDPAKAAPWLEAALRVSPFNPLPHCGLAEAYRARGPAFAERTAREQAACASLRE